MAAHVRECASTSTQTERLAAIREKARLAREAAAAEKARLKALKEEEEAGASTEEEEEEQDCLLYTSPSPRDRG